MARRVRLLFERPDRPPPEAQDRGRSYWLLASNFDGYSVPSSVVSSAPKAAADRVRRSEPMMAR